MILSKTMLEQISYRKNSSDHGRTKNHVKSVFFFTSVWDIEEFDPSIKRHCPVNDNKARSQRNYNFWSQPRSLHNISLLVREYVFLLAEQTSTLYIQSIKLHLLTLMHHVYALYSNFLCLTRIKGSRCSNNRRGKKEAINILSANVSKEPPSPQ